MTIIFVNVSRRVIHYLTVPLLLVTLNKPMQATKSPLNCYGWSHLVHYSYVSQQAPGGVWAGAIGMRNL